jgi:streptomycin 3"-adenylyltransferase
VITRRTLTEVKRRAVTAGLLRLSGDGAEDRRFLEVTIVVQSQVRPWRYPPHADLLFGEWLRAEIEANGPPQPTEMPSLAIEISQVLADPHILKGPDPQELLDPVPVSDIIQAGLDGMPALLADLRDDTRNVLLTLARIWATTATGHVLSKESAATWALARLPANERPVLEHALHLYRTSTYAEEAPWPQLLRSQLDSHVGAILGEIERAAGTPFHV